MSNPTQVTSEVDSIDQKPTDLCLSLQLDPELVRDFPLELAQNYQVLPIGKFGRRGMILVSGGELPGDQLKVLRKKLGATIHFVTAPKSEVEALVKSVVEGPREGDPLDHEAEPEVDEAEDESPASEEAGYDVEPKRLAEVLVEIGAATAEELDGFLEKPSNGDPPQLDASLFIDAKNLRLIPEELAREEKILPVAHLESGLVIAVSKFLDAPVVSKIRQLTGLMPKMVIVDPGELEAAVRACYDRRQYLKAAEMPLGDYLIAEGYLERSQLDGALQEQKRSKEKLGEILVRRGFVTEDTIFKYLADRLGYEYRRFSTADIDLELSKLVSQRFAERSLVLPLTVDYETKELEVAMAEPYDLKVVDTLKSLVGQHNYQLKTVLSSPANIEEGISYLYNFQGLVEDEVEMETVGADVEPERKDLILKEDLPKIRRIINQVLYRAVVEGASDVHIENLENRVRVRFRMDGLLQERKTSITKDNIRSVISVFKVDATLDITENRRAQDGVFKMCIGKDHFVDFRVNLHNTDFGQDAVIRILDTSKNLLPLDALGCSPRMLERYLALVENPQGLILFTGPTGSGKSTTLYSTLAHLNSPEKKIVTAEDPVEYYLDGICQYKVNESIGNTFAEYARRFLRKDPDIILIGEIRDEATAESCLRAAMTGHLVFSTLHTNDSVGALERLKNLGVDTATTAEALLAVVSQRLARRICAKCRQPYAPEPGLFDLFYPNGRPDDVEFSSGVGCAACDYLGYRGRVGLYEYWELNPETLLAIADKGGNLRDVARRSGMISMVEDALEKVRQGRTTLEELRRVLPLDQIRAQVRFERQRLASSGQLATDRGNVRGL